ncbi:MAG: cyclic nucleotide-binding/CBS domain-containing protein [Betaproteobacteria bacterium]|nr:CBS domain-containing protein [Betaproteobacteria bacterium]
MDTVRELMQSKPALTLITIPPDALMTEAMRIMLDKGIHSLLVYENNKMIGIVSDRDYSRKVLAQGLDQATTTVGTVMSRRVITVDPEASVMDTMRLMSEHGFRHLPVEEHGQIIGMVSWSDIMSDLLN